MTRTQGAEQHTANGRHPPDLHAVDDDDDFADQVRRYEQQQAEPALERSSWAPIDLGPYLRGEVERPTPSIGLVRSDGLQLLYPGRESTVMSEMEHGKGWVAAASTVAEITRGRTVVYIDFEEPDPAGLVERLRALGAGHSDILHNLRFVCPERAVTRDVLDQLLDPAPVLVILDGVNEGMSLHGCEIREEGGVAAFRRRMVKPFTAVGAAVLSCDHVVKNTENRGRTPLGSIHKGNALSGSLILLENAEPFGRGTRGRSHVYITKDRPGHLRRHGRPDPKTPGRTYLGELVIDDTQHNSPDLELKFWAPRTDDTPDQPQASSPDDVVHATIRRITADGHAATVRAVEASSGLRKAATGEAIERLLIAGRITEAPGPRRARIFTATTEDRPHD